jgi:nicotinate-nucleotide--dimethylbenzimidazole phosphoribosyltransferase
VQQILERVASIAPLDSGAMELARTRQQQLTKPAGSLGRLEDIAIHISGITGHPLPRIQRKAVIIMAGDHGVTGEGVSAYPADVTPQMVHNFLQGGAAINALAHYARAKVIVVDVGVAADIAHPDLLSRKVAFGTANMALEPAMTHAQMLQAIQVGIDVCDAQLEQGIDLVATGDMGIGNTTASSAITAALLQIPVALVLPDMPR